MRRLVLFPYKMYSASAKKIANLLGIKRVYPDRKYRQRENDVVINWGRSTPGVWGSPAINKTDGVKRAINKLDAFMAMSAAGISLPQFSTDKEVAQEWAAKGKVVVRHVLTGHGGAGTTIIKRGEEVPDAPLYTKYFKKERELRIHVVKDFVIKVAEKKRRKNAEVVDPYIRSHGRGWVFCINNLDPVPEEALKCAVNAVKALGLDFGAVDLGWNQKNGCVVFEINSAPGLDNSTAECYANAFKENF